MDPDILALKGKRIEENDGEITFVKPKKQCGMLRYNSNLKFCWDVVITTSVILNGFYLPFEISF